METESLNASVGLKNARYGGGQYLTNLESKNLTPDQLSRNIIYEAEVYNISFVLLKMVFIKLAN